MKNIKKNIKKKMKMDMNKEMMGGGMNLRKIGNSFRVLSIVLLLVFLFLVHFLPDFAFASMGEDLISRNSWKKISLDLERASLINVLKVFSQQSGLNFIAAQDVAGTSITLYLEDVPIREALEKILYSYNLTYELDLTSNIFVVKKLIRPEVETVTKIYPLQYARVNASPLNTDSAVSKSGSSLTDTLEAMLSEHGKINEDSRTNSLIVTDVPLQFEIIDKTVRQLDVPIPQVIIEAEIIDARKALTDQLGMQWSGSLYSLTLAGRTGLAFPFQSWHNRDEVTAITTGSVEVPTDSTSATLQLLMTDTTTRVLARPKILTLSNETAEINITGNEAVGLITTIDSESGVQNTSAERYEIGVSLKVTPSVNAATGEITMVIEPTVSSTQVSVVGTSYYDPQERSTKVTMVAKDNQTVVIGGLIRKDLSDVRTKMPILGDIPFLGSLFRHKNKTKQDRELLVFITPRIVKDSGVDLVRSRQQPYNRDILSQREQSDYQFRREEVDKTLTNWDNK
ncbi:type II secretion system protein GspD [Candidatus Omnitrophota bacterium]